MDIINTHCAGLDVHKKTVVAAIIVPDKGRGLHKETRSFGTMTGELLTLSDWLMSLGVTHVAMESTGEYWKPIYNILENNFEVLLVNAHHISKVPGRKTDVSDLEWIADLLRHGLLRGSFVPPIGQRELRELTRCRSTFVKERATLVNRVQKVLESANIKLASVASDVLGVSGRAMLEAIIQGTAAPEEMAELSKGSLRNKRKELSQALEGRVKAHHRFVLTEYLSQIDSLDEAIERFNQEIEEYCRPFEDAVVLLDTIPGVARRTGVAPGNNESAGKRRSGKTTKGNRALNVALTQAAHAAARTKNTYLSAQYGRLVGRRGKKRAIRAVAHSILIIAYHLIDRNEPYRELGGDYFDQRNPEAVAKRLLRRIQKLGFEVEMKGLFSSVPA